MYDSTFTPKGSTVLVGTAVVQVLPTLQSDTITSYRVRCLVAGYLTWGQANVSSPPPSLTATAPAAGTPSVNTIGMSMGGVETFQLPPNAYFISSVAAGFEVTPGEGV